MSFESDTRINRYKDPKVIGPGVHYSIHSLVEEAVLQALNTVENPDVAVYAERSFMLAVGYIDHTQRTFACHRCRAHIQEFVASRPLEKIVAKYATNPVGAAQELSIWAYDLHNNANRYAGRPSENYDDMAEFFRSGEVCNEDCGDMNPQFTLQSTIKPQSMSQELVVAKESTNSPAVVPSPQKTETVPRTTKIRIIGDAPPKSPQIEVSKEVIALALGSKPPAASKVIIASQSDVSVTKVRGFVVMGDGDSLRSQLK